MKLFKLFSPTSFPRNLNENESAVPAENCMSKVNNEDTMTVAMHAILVSLFLSLNRYLSTGLGPIFLDKFVSFISSELFLRSAWKNYENSFRIQKGKKWRKKADWKCLYIQRDYGKNNQKPKHLVNNKILLDLFTKIL